MIDHFAPFRTRHTGVFARFNPPALTGGAASIVVSGDLDTATSTDFLECAMACVGSMRAGDTLELQLEGVSYISSMGVGSLAKILAEADGRQIKLRVSAMSPACRDVFSVLGLLRYFGVEEPASSNQA